MPKAMMSLALVATTLVGAQANQENSEPTQVFALKEEAATIEYTATSNEAVVIFEAESESFMRNIQIRQPDGTPVLRLWAGAGQNSSISGFVIETGEQSAEGLLENFGAGRYQMSAVSAEGVLASGGADLSHALLPAPVVIYPQEGEIGVSTTATVVWVPDANAVEYRVVFEQDDNDGLTARLPAGSSSFQVPAGVLRSQTVSHVEVGAVDKSGNSTLVEIEFVTL